MLYEEFVVISLRKKQTEITCRTKHRSIIFQEFTSTCQGWSDAHEWNVNVKLHNKGWVEDPRV